MTKYSGSLIVPLSILLVKRKTNSGYLGLKIRFFGLLFRVALTERKRLSIAKLAIITLLKLSYADETLKIKDKFLL